jgi:hypothetical protein
VAVATGDTPEPARPVEDASYGVDDTMRDIHDQNQP